MDSRPPRSKLCDDHCPEHSGTLGALRRLLEVWGQSGPALRGDRRSALVALAAYDQASAPQPRMSGYSEGRPRRAGRPGSSMSEPSKLSLRVGCTGCQRRWGEGEGQCSRCRRCLYCCGVEAIRYTCAWRAARKTPDQQRRSAEAYERWAVDVRILSRNRRIT